MTVLPLVAADPVAHRTWTKQRGSAAARVLSGRMGGVLYVSDSLPVWSEQVCGLAILECDESMCSSLIGAFCFGVAWGPCLTSVFRDPGHACDSCHVSQWGMARPPLNNLDLKQPWSL